VHAALDGSRCSEWVRSFLGTFEAVASKAFAAAEARDLEPLGHLGFGGKGSFTL
jgi:hypothetical protein